MVFPPPAFSWISSPKRPSQSYLGTRLDNTFPRFWGAFPFAKNDNSPLGGRLVLQSRLPSLGVRRLTNSLGALGKADGAERRRCASYAEQRWSPDHGFLRPSGAKPDANRVRGETTKGLTEPGARRNGTKGRTWKTNSFGQKRGLQMLRCSHGLFRGIRASRPAS